MCGNGVAGGDGVVYGIGVVEVVLVEIGPGVGVSDVEVEVVKVAGFDGGNNVGGVSKGAVPDDAASEVGASRVVERGQGKPAMDASRLFSMTMGMIVGAKVGNIKGCNNTRGKVVIQACTGSM